ncbi:cell cycle regulator of non-homologous end joining isoform X2 [Phascolarctos cinereus]|uniref:Modulator of retrovirus infection homolog isoform X1 n=1 Tax=Phascolarctos cinereus TaxID=38626 RepID=A0A6P5LI19_PHACI|nr:modulator of retrovirus infection homolog isoform X1 [Phascolarctos cinereus]
MEASQEDKNHSAVSRCIIEGMKHENKVNVCLGFQPETPSKRTAFFFYRFGEYRKKYRTSLPSDRTVYFMNEAELVDIALGVLVECRKQEKPLEHTLLLGTDKAQTTQPESPWASENSSNGEEVVNDALRTSPSGKQEYSASGHKNSEDEDALKYVREIFFS